MIRLDTSSCSVVVVCTTCSSWRELTFTSAAAWAAGARHQAAVHPGVGQAQNALEQQRHRNSRS